LFGQHDQLLSGNLFHRLERLDGAEGPAAAALPLVLDWGQRARVPPVLGGRSIGGLTVGSPLLEAYRGLEPAQINRLEFIF